MAVPESASDRSGSEKPSLARALGLVGRPPVPDELKRQSMTVSLPSDVAVALTDLQRTLDRSRSEIVRDALVFFYGALREIAESTPQDAASYALANLENRFFYPESLEEEPLNDFEMQLAGNLAAQALSAWASPDRSTAEVAAALGEIFSAAVRAIRTAQ